MQHLDLAIIKAAKKQKVKQLEAELHEYFAGQPLRTIIECPLCHYAAEKTGKHSGRINQNADGEFIFNCFACKEWRVW